ncbi:MAG TPA: TIM barrel protein [Fimbriimonas sp.]|nr:TIM barrel protein [Fimbriimonas sp.]
MSDVSRRAVLAGTSAAALGVAANTFAMNELDPIAELGKAKRGEKFRLKYAPHFGMFGSVGNDIDQLKFAADEGFHAWEDNGMKGRSVADQEKIAKTMTDLGITMGVFVVNGDTAWNNSISSGKGLEKFIEECKSSVDVAKRVNAKWMTVVPGSIDYRLEPGYQTANVVEALRRGAEIFEPHGLVMVLEPLNYRDHPSQFLNKIAQSYQICHAVKSPACKTLFDMYHQQIHEGNIIPNIDLAYSEVAYFQIGDNPGRNEPLTGEMNYRNIFKHIHGKGFTGVLGMEHGNSQRGIEGERKLIDAYRWCDAF